LRGGTKPGVDRVVSRTGRDEVVPEPANDRVAPGASRNEVVASSTAVDGGVDIRVGVVERMESGTEALAREFVDSSATRSLPFPSGSSRVKRPANRTAGAGGVTQQDDFTSGTRIRLEVGAFAPTRAGTRTVGNSEIPKAFSQLQSTTLSFRFAS